MEDPSIEVEINSEDPLLGISKKALGGIKTLPFITVNEFVESMANNGLSQNMTKFLMGKYGLLASQTSNILFLWASATGFSSVIGALLADSLVGRFPMIAFGCIFTVLGLILLWLTSIIPQARPFCDKFSGSCESPTTIQLVLLNLSLGFMAIGSGGIRSSSLAFGGDQLIKKQGKHLESFISWYYVSTVCGSLIGMTLLVYIQDKIGWSLGFGIPAVLMFLSMISFFFASPFFVKMRPTATFLTDIFQVIVASYRKRNVELSSINGLYHHKPGSTLLIPTESLRFLNKACIITNSEEEEITSSDPWSLCTVDQVEDLKSIIRIIPIWSSGIMFIVALYQTTVPYLILSSMDRHVTANFEFPVGSFAMFLFVSIGLWIILYDRLLVPLATKIRGKPTRMLPKDKIGFGIFLSCISMVIMALIERARRAMAIEEGLSDDPNAVVKMSAFWLLLFYLVGGIACGSCVTGQMEFFYSQLPKSMASIALALVGLNSAAGNLVAGFIMTTVDNVSKVGGGESWVSSNINKGHCDYYYWLLCGLCFLNFLYYLACRKSYGFCEGEDDESSKGYD